MRVITGLRLPIGNSRGAMLDPGCYGQWTQAID
jgi:hypothetical protein